MKLKMMALSTVAAAAFAPSALAATEITVATGEHVTAGQLGNPPISTFNYEFMVASPFRTFFVYINAEDVGAGKVGPPVIAGVTNKPAVAPNLMKKVTITLRCALCLSPFTRSFSWTPAGDGASPLLKSPALNMTVGVGRVVTLTSIIERNPESTARTGYSFAVTAIPEPSTWMLMIMGFGLIASQLRRRYREGVATAA